MEITVFKAILIGLVYYCGSSFWLNGWLSITRPFIGATIVGIIMGDPTAGAMIGASIQLIYMGWMLVGGATTTDSTFAGVVATALAIAGGLETGAALTLAVPLGLIASWVWGLRNTINTFIMHLADKAAAEGNVKAIAPIAIWLPQIPLLLITALPTALLVYFGSDVISTAFEAMGTGVMNVLNTVGGVLPALGIALTLKLIMKKSLIPYFFLGFLLAASMGMSPLVVACFSVIAAALYVMPKLKADSEG